MQTDKNPPQYEIDEPDWVFKGRIPYLDGLRAISITLVILAHLAQMEWIGPGLGATLVRKAHFGHLGVTTFFVLSGFLITLLLLREFRSTQTVHLKNFYIRRTFRILPAYVAYLIFVYLLTKMNYTEVDGSSWFAAVTYATGLFPPLNSSWHLGHLWSLSVEEHFYLLWPFLICRLGPRKALFWATGWVLITPAIRFLMWQRFSGQIDINYASATQMSSIATGCLMAFVVFYRPSLARSRIHALTRLPKFEYGMVVLISSIVLGSVSWKYALLLQDPVNAASIAVLILGLLYGRETFFTRLLESRPFVTVGILSYSLYLWQQAFLASTDAWINQWPLNLLWVVVAAVSSYLLIEAPFLRLKEKFKAGKAS